jgi:hypothetical protein
MSKNLVIFGIGAMVNFEASPLMAMPVFNTLLGAIDYRDTRAVGSPIYNLEIVPMDEKVIDAYRMAYQSEKAIDLSEIIKAFTTRHGD